MLYGQFVDGNSLCSSRISSWPRPSVSIVLQTGYACAREAPPSGAIASALHALTLLIARQVTHELESLDGSIDYHVVPPLCP
jgi:hypothetical protein